MSKRSHQWIWTIILGLMVSTFATAQNHSGLASETDAEGEWQVNAMEKAERVSLAAQIMAERERRAGRAFDEAWAAGWVEKLSQRDLPSLHELLTAAESGEQVPLKTLGSTTEDLVFTPLPTACRTVDTRSDQFSGNLSRDNPYEFKVTGSSLGTPNNQGGAVDCGIPFGPAVAVTANIIAVDPEGKGNMQVWDWSSVMKGASVINFGGPANNVNLINGIMIPICNPALASCSFDLNAEVNFTDADMVFSVTGYFAPPEATAVDCTTVSNTETHSATFSVQSGDCPSGYSLTGGGHDWIMGSTDVWLWQVSPNVGDTGYICRGNVDRGGNSSDITCFARCCRTPGR